MSTTHAARGSVAATSRSGTAWRRTLAAIISGKSCDSRRRWKPVASLTFTPWLSLSVVNSAAWRRPRAVATDDRITTLLSAWWRRTAFYGALRRSPATTRRTSTRGRHDRQLAGWEPLRRGHSHSASRPRPARVATTDDCGHDRRHLSALLPTLEARSHPQAGNYDIETLYPQTLYPEPAKPSSRFSKHLLLAIQSNL